MPQQSNTGLADFNVDPTAEQRTGGTSGVSGQEEEAFFRNAGEQFRLAHNQQNLGLLGKLFGANSTAPTNIAGFVIIVAFVMIVVTMFAGEKASELADLRNLLLGLIGSAMSFIFGAATRK